MESRDQEKLQGELVRLMEKQAATLRDRTFGGITEEELRDYDERRERIRDLLIELYYLDPAA
jgi:hypothetical protein